MRKCRASLAVLALAGIVLGAMACTDAAPTGVSQLKSEDDPAKKLIEVTWYTCWRYESQTEFTCDWDGPIGRDLYWIPDPWEAHTVPIMYTSLKDCSMDPSLCDTRTVYTSMIPQPERYDGDIRAIPNCLTTTNKKDKLWCNGDRLSVGSPRRKKIEAIRDDLRARGGVCAEMANTVDALLSRGHLRIFVRAPGDSVAGFAPIGGGSSGPFSYMALSTDWTDNYIDKQHTTKGEPYRRYLQYALVHELDHLHGRDHDRYPDGSENKFLTASSQQCSDVP